MAGTRAIARENGKKGGRPKGSTNVPQFRDHITQKDIDAWLEILRDQVVQDNKLLMWALDHYYGKAPQPIQGEFTGSLVIEISETIAKKNHVAHSNTGQGSK